MNDAAHARKYGLFSLPAIVHFEDGVPNVYDEDMNIDAIMNWLEDQKSGSFIEKVTPAMLQTLLQKQEYVVVLFLTNCDKSEECERIIGELEEVDEEMDRIDVLFVYLDDDSYAAKMKIREFPALIYFRNGQPLKFEGHIENEMAVLKFVTSFENIMLPNQIEEVGVPMLEYFLKEKDDVFVYLYDEDDSR